MEGMKENEEGLRLLDKAEQLHDSHIDFIHIPFIAQLGRIPSEDIIPSLLSESPETIRKSLSVIDGDRRASVVKAARELLESTLEGGAEISQADEKLKAIIGEDD